TPQPYDGDHLAGPAEFLFRMPGFVLLSVDFVHRLGHKLKCEVVAAIERFRKPVSQVTLQLTPRHTVGLNSAAHSSIFPECVYRPTLESAENIRGGLVRFRDQLELAGNDRRDRRNMRRDNGYRTSQFRFETLPQGPSKCRSGSLGVREIDRTDHLFEEQCADRNRIWLAANRAPKHALARDGFVQQGTEKVVAEMSIRPLQCGEVGSGE